MVSDAVAKVKALAVLTGSDVPLLAQARTPFQILGQTLSPGFHGSALCQGTSTSQKCLRSSLRMIST